MALKLSITGASPEQLGKVKWNRKELISTKTPNRCAKAIDARLYNLPDYHNLRQEATCSAKSERDIGMKLGSTDTTDLGKLFRLLHSMLRDGSSHFISSSEKSSKERSNILANCSTAHPIKPISVTLPGDVKQYEIDLEPFDESEITLAVQIRSHPVRMEFHSRSLDLVC